VRRRPDFEIVSVVACVIESFFAKLRNQAGLFCLTGQVDGSVACQYPVEQVEVLGDLASDALIATRGQNQPAPAGPLILQECEEWLMIGQGTDIEADSLVDLLLEKSLSLEQPEGDGKEIKGVPLDQGEERLDEQIGFYQCPVEVDNKRIRFRHWIHRSFPGERIFRLKRPVKEKKEKGGN
jgi:hypothetical protein